MKIPTFQDTFNRYVEWSIEHEEIHRELLAYCRKLGHDYDEVVEHISAEVEANRSAR
nr:hypothetical protein [uncultured bacterium]